jgi:AbrB family looped-hinge helix DNA binding protein
VGNFRLTHIEEYFTFFTEGKAKMNTTVSSKGQITLPRFVREALGLKAGSTVTLTLEKGELRLKPAPAGLARRLAGSLRRYARPGTVKSIRAEVKRKVSRAAAAEGTSD